MHILILEVLGGLACLLLVGLLVAVIIGSFARAGAGVYGDPSPKPTQPARRVLVLDQAEAAPRLLTEIGLADAWIARELAAIPPVAKRRVGQGLADSDPVHQHHVARVG